MLHKIIKYSTILSSPSTSTEHCSKQNKPHLISIIHLIKYLEFHTSMNSIHFESKNSNWYSSKFFTSKKIKYTVHTGSDFNACETVTAKIRENELEHRSKMMIRTRVWGLSDVLFALAAIVVNSNIELGADAVTHFKVNLRSMPNIYSFIIIHENENRC